MIQYVAFLRDKATAGAIDKGLLRAWFTFPEVKQNWLGYCEEGNQGSGLGMDFAGKFHFNMENIFKDFGAEKVTRGTHIEKVFVTSDVGRDNISDFVTNIIKDYLCRFTEQFAREHLNPEHVRRVAVPKVRFNYKTEAWEQGVYDLPSVNGDYVLLTPLDLLTKDEIWINRKDLWRDYPQIAASIPNDQLRAQVNNYFEKALEEIVKRDEEAKQRKSTSTRTRRRRQRKAREPNATQKTEASRRTVAQFPGLIDFYIRRKEDTGEIAEQQADEKVRASEQLYIAQVRDLSNLLAAESDFYGLNGADPKVVGARLESLKLVVEEKGGWRAFYAEDEPVSREADLRVILRLAWLADPSTGKGAPDAGPTLYKLGDLVQFKLASNPKVDTALIEHRDGTATSKTAILCFSRREFFSMSQLLRVMKLEDTEEVILIDARPRKDTEPQLARAG